MNRPAMDRLAARRPPPRRSGAGPLVVVAVIALVPALILFGVFAWADGRVDDNEAAPPPPSTVVAPPLPAEPLRNAVLNMRRLPGPLSRDLNVEQFVDEVAATFPALNDRSCLSISVDGEPVATQNSGLAVIPASTLKLLVAAAALEILGPDFRYTTSVAAAAGPTDGVIAGDLVLVGGGDPLLGSDWYPTSNLERRPVFNQTSLDDLANRVQAAGVTQITGNVLGDGSRYDDEFYVDGWGNGVAGLEAGPYDALMANDARVLGEDQRADDPNAAAAREFARLLRDRGISVGGDPSSGSVSVLGDSPTEIASIESVPLTDVVTEMLTNSDNNTAELLVKEIGFASDPSGVGTRTAGLAAIDATLSGWGVETSAVVLADGSGLSPADRVTCDVLLAVLQRSPADGPIGSALAVAGQTGTLADVFVDDPVAGRLLGKTGTLNNPPFNEDPPAVKALAGYLPVDGGGAVEFALVLNGPTISDQSEYRPIWQALADVVDTYPSGPSPSDLGLLR